MICGHRSQRAALHHALDSGRVPHALILSGPRQLGKTTVARGLARALLCAAPVAGEACESCPACVASARGGHPDFEVVRPVLIRDRAGGDEPGARGAWDPAPESMPAAVLPIGLVRPLRERATRRAVRGERKVVLIEEADHLTDDAQDALLKTIEEPSSGLSILLVAANACRLRATVRSRCWSLPFAFVEDEEVARWLRDHHGVPPTRAGELAAHAGGRPGAAWRRWQHPELDQLHGQLDRLADDLLQGSPAVQALQHAESCERLARDFFEAECASDRRPVTLASGHLSKVQRSATVRLVEELAARAARGRNPRCLDAFLEAEHHLLQNTNVRLTLDVMCLRCANV